MLVAVYRLPALVVAVADPIKASTPEAVRELRVAGVTIFMLTCDNRNTARSVAEQLCISEFVAEVLPQYKHRLVKEMQYKSRIVAMASDCINYSPSLSQSNVCIAMWYGTESPWSSRGSCSSCACQCVCASGSCVCSCSWRSVRWRYTPAAMSAPAIQRLAEAGSPKAAIAIAAPMKGAVEKYAPVRAVPRLAQGEHEQHEAHAVTGEPDQHRRGGDARLGQRGAERERQCEVRAPCDRALQPSDEESVAAGDHPGEIVVERPADARRRDERGAEMSLRVRLRRVARRARHRRGR